MSRIFALLSLTLLLATTTACPGEPVARRVVFDQGHRQLFSIEKEGDLQLGNFAGILGEAGLTVSSTAEPLTPETLAKVEALVISGPFRAYTPAEVSAVMGFLHGGGRVAIMLHIAQPMWGLLGKLGVEAANGVVRDPKRKLEGDEMNFEVNDFTGHALTEKLEAFKLYGGWPLRPVGDSAKVLAWSSAASWVDLNGDKTLGTGDAVQSFGVVVGGTVGKGGFVAFSDDAIFQNRFLVDDNRKLAENLGHWLAGE